MSVPLLELDRLSVRRGRLTVLRELSLAIAPGEAVGVHGPNGSGKSSLMAGIVGLLPVSGGLRWEGRDIARLPPHRRARLGIGYCPERRRVFPGLSVRDNLLVASRAAPAGREAKLSEILALFPPLARRIDVAAWRLSGGEQQMLAVGRAVMAAPRLLLLDEPMLGLAGDAVAALAGALEAIAAAGTAILLAEQDTESPVTICKRWISL